MPPSAIDFLYSNGPVCNELLQRTMPRLTMFTGSQHVAEKLTLDMKGRVKLEDAGFDWKILGPDVAEVDYVTWQSEQDAYAFSGQKCSAQSILFAHKNWMKETHLIDKMASRAATRKLSNLTNSPLLSVTNTTLKAHQTALLTIPGAHLLFGGGPLTEEHSIPDKYGSYQPTAVFVPITQAVKPEFFDLVTTEIFGPFQVVTEYDDSQLNLVLDMCERMESHLTAAIVSNDPAFQNKVLGATINGTTYMGIRARCTGAPQQHWFGPAGDPLAGGIHTVEAIQQTWTCHREVITDSLVPPGWSTPPVT
jgi:1-pyrroline-5-carboxylate dehydrogenase